MREMIKGVKCGCLGKNDGHIQHEEEKLWLDNNFKHMKILEELIVAHFVFNLCTKNVLTVKSLPWHLLSIQNIYLMSTVIIYLFI